jgi:hypothetical protein
VMISAWQFRIFLSSGELLKQVNHSIISLVPKSTKISTPNDLRPISCCNVIYKVTSKILAGRDWHWPFRIL